MFVQNSPLQLYLIVFFTLALFSVLYKDNAIYKLVQSLYVGLSVAYNLAQNWFSYGRPTLVNIGTKGQFILVLPIILGLLIYTRYFKSIAWIARYYIAFSVGVGSGYILSRDWKPNFVQQIAATFQPLFRSGATFGTTLNSLILVIGVLGTMSYFLFTRERKGAVAISASVGRWMMMVAFGSAFGNTIAGRVSTLLGRMQFLLGDWLHVMAK